MNNNIKIESKLFLRKIKFKTKNHFKKNNKIKKNIAFVKCPICKCLYNFHVRYCKECDVYLKPNDMS